MMTIIGTLRDIQPNQAKPCLELYFDAKDRASFAVGTRVVVEIEIEDVRWRGTMATSGEHPPYLHTWLKSDRGVRANCTTVFQELGLAEKAKLEFVVKEPGVYELLGVIEKGLWRQGNEPHQLRTRSPSTARDQSRLRADARVEKETSVARPSAGTPAFPAEDRDEILRLADAYWRLITVHEAAEERAFEHELPAARVAGFLSKPLFIRLGRWKSVRNTANYESNSDDAIRTATITGFNAPDDATPLRSLMELRGVALRTASAILHWMRPDRFPVLDFRVVGALNVQEPSSYEELDFYETIANRVRALAERHSLDLRTIDRALWAWDKLHSKG